MRLKTTLIATAALALALPGQALAAPKSKIKPDAASYVVKETDGVAQIKLNRTRNLQQEVSVGYVTANGTATSPSDYTSSSGRVTFAAGATQATIEIPITNDNVQESTEIFTVLLKQPSRRAVAVNPKVTVTIADNDGSQPRIEYGLANFRISEGLGTAQIAIIRSGPTTTESKVTWATANGSALAGEDYTAAGDQVTFVVGDVVEYCNVTILDDNTPEDAEQSLSLSLSGITTDAVYGAQAASTLTILDDDSAPALQFSSDSTSETVAENGDAVNLSVVRSGSLSGAATVEFVTEALTAASGVDFEASPAAPDNELAFGPGEYEQIVSIPVLDDTTDESDETFRVNLENALYEGATDATGAAMTSTVTIADDDEPVVVENPGDDTVDEGGDVTNVTTTNTTVSNTNTTITNPLAEESGLLVLGERLGGCKLTVGAVKSQRILRAKSVRVKLHAVEACTGSVKAHVKGRKSLRGVKKGAVQTKVVKFALKAGQTKTIKMAFSKRGYALLKRALGKQRTLSASLLVRSVNPAKRVTLNTLRWKARR